MAKDWRELDVSDFGRHNGPHAGILARVELFGRAIDLDIGDESITKQMVELFKVLLHYWEANIEDIARKVQEYINIFLPGRMVDQNEICVEWLMMYCDSETHIPNGCVVMFRLAGEYSSPRYKLREFDERSYVEVAYDIDGGVLDLNSEDMDVSNDFD